MGFYSNWLFPRLLDMVMQQKQMVPFRQRIGGAATGRVLDVGIGSGLNLPFYGQQTERVFGVDPSAELLGFADKPCFSAPCTSRIPPPAVCGPAITPVEF